MGTGRNNADDDSDNEKLVRKMYCDVCKGLHDHYLWHDKTEKAGKKFVVHACKVCSNCLSKDSKTEPKAFKLSAGDWNAIVQGSFL